MTISASRGSSRSMSLRLCSRAPEMTIRSDAATHTDSSQANRCSQGESLGRNALISGMREEMRSHAAVAELAGRQHGLVTHRQLRRLGFSSGSIARSTKALRLHRVHRGVYSVGHPVLSDRGRCLAAVMASGRGAVVSHGAAAWLWGLLPSFPKTIDVTVSRHGGRRSDIALHHSSTLVPEEHGRFGPIPVT